LQTVLLTVLQTVLRIEIPALKVVGLTAGTLVECARILAEVILGSSNIVLETVLTLRFLCQFTQSIHPRELTVDDPTCLRTMPYCDPVIIPTEVVQSRLTDIVLKSNYGLFNRNNIYIRYWSWNYRGCWHQTCPPMVFSSVCRYNPLQALMAKPVGMLFFVAASLVIVLALGNLRTCCCP